MTKTKPLWSVVLALALAAVLLTLAAGRPAEAAFPGANGNIAFQRNGDIWLSSATSATSDRFLTNLTPNTSSQDVDPSVSPDGRKVAFTSNRDGDFEIYTLDIYTGTLTQVTHNAVRDAQPAWSLDGTRIAYESPTTAPGRTDTDIWIKNADGTGTETDATSSGASDERAPSWRPIGGNEIAYYLGSARHIVVRNLDTNATRTLCPDPGGPLSASCLHPNWSPDGSRIAYQYRPGASSDYEIWTLRSSDGGDKRQLSDNTFEDGDAAYSPDGARITFIRNDFGDYDVWIMSSQDDGTGSDEMRSTPTADNDVSPDWGDVAPPAAPGCTMSGTFFADTIVGNAGNNTICSLGGNDDIEGLGGRDTLIAGDGNDRLLGGGGRDTLDSRDGVNRNDFLNGGPGRDRCRKDTGEASVRSCP
jgi:Tol biopolymer transport system component